MLLWDRLMLTTAHDLHKCAVPPNGPVSKLDALVHLWYRPEPQELSVECICVSLCSSSSHSWWGQKIKAGKPCVFVWASEGGVFMDKRIRKWGKNGGISRSETGVKEGDKKGGTGRCWTNSSGIFVSVTSSKSVKHVYLPTCPLEWHWTSGSGNIHSIIIHCIHQKKKISKRRQRGIWIEKYKNCLIYPKHVCSANLL